MANEYQVTYRGTVSTQALQHVRYFQANGIPTAGDLQAFADTLGASFKGAFQALVPSAVTYQDLYIRPNIPGALGASFIPASWSFVGTGTGDPLPPYVTTNIRLRSGGIPLPNKGLVQMPSVTETSQAAGVIIPAALTSWNTAAIHFRSLFIPATGPNWSPVLFSDVTNTYNAITVTSVLPNLGSQAARKYGKGN